MYLINGHRLQFRYFTLDKCPQSEEKNRGDETE